MATKSSKKKTAPKKAATKPKIAAKKTAVKKVKTLVAKKAKTVVKAAVKKKLAAKKVTTKIVKKKAVSATKPVAKKIIKVVNKKQNKPAVAKSKATKPAKKVVKKAVVVKVKPVKAAKKIIAKPLEVAKTNKATAKVELPKINTNSNKQVLKASTVEAKNETPLKPVTKPILKKTASDAAVSQRNMAIRAKYKKLEIEYPLHSAKHILFSYLSTSSGLSEWFADKVNEKGDIMVFEWDGAQQAAKVLSAREDHHIRFRWLDMPEAIYFEFRVETDEITGDLALIITDFCEDESGIESARNLWNSQIENLFHVLGIH
jgi:hypothetical protein